MAEQSGKPFQMEAMDAEILRRTFPRRKILEIGAGPIFFLDDSGVPLSAGDHYLAVDIARRPKKETLAELERNARARGVQLSYAKADGLELPVKTNSIDHVVLHNVLSERGFPNTSMLEYRRKRETTFREAVEKLEAEMRRVTKPRATAALQHQHTAEELYATEPDGKTKMQHIREVFGQHWHIETTEKVKKIKWRGKLADTLEVYMTLRKKEIEKQ